MAKKRLQITVDEDIYKGLYSRIGERQISAFICTLVRPHVVDDEAELERLFAEQTRDKERETKALAWSEGLITDIQDETW